MIEGSDSADIPTVIADCNVLLHAAALRPVALRVVRAIEAGRIPLIVSTPTFLELHEILYRPRVRAKLPDLTDALAEYMLALLEERTIPFRQTPRVFVYDRDPKDEKYINLAIAAQPDHLLTFDKDLLTLANDAEFLRHCPNTKIISPADVNLHEEA